MYSIKVMNDFYLRKYIISFFGYKCTECKKYKNKMIKSRKLCICFDCFKYNWKYLFK